MKQILASLTVLLALAGTAQAACYADYKAKRDTPLRLHYGVAEIKGDCTIANAGSELADRLAADNWKLLAVLSVFDDSGLEERKANAGDYYLRY